MGRVIMELIFERDKLWEAMQIVGSVAASRNTLPILANVLIRAAEDQIQLAATDLEVGMKSVVQGEVVEPGSTTVPAKKLADIVRELPSSTSSGELAKVRLATLANDRVEIDCENAKFRIVGLTDEEFPSLPEVGDEFFTLGSDVLRSMIQKTSFAVSTEETRHFLNGVYFNVTPDIAFAAQKMTLTSRLIEGEYPDYQAVMAPAMSNEIKLSVNTEYLFSVIRRVSLLANPKTPSIRMESKDSELNVSASTPELGEAQEMMQVNIEGGNVEIAFNARFVMDVLRNIEADEVLFKFRDSLSPVLVTPSEENNYMCVIMPMRL